MDAIAAIRNYTLNQKETIQKRFSLVSNIFSKIILKYVKKHTNNRMVAILKYVRKLTNFRMRGNQIGEGELYIYE